MRKERISAFIVNINGDVGGNVYIAPPETHREKEESIASFDNKRSEEARTEAIKIENKILRHENKKQERELRRLKNWFKVIEIVFTIAVGWLLTVFNLTKNIKTLEAVQ